MRFAIIDAFKQTVSLHNGTQDQAEAAAGLKRDKVDFGVVRRGLGVIVDEFGLFAAPDQMRYFSIDRKLYAGSAVLYAFNQMGETIDITEVELPDVTFMSGEGAKRNIELGLIECPETRVNGVVFWRWPSPPTAGMHQ